MIVERKRRGTRARAGKRSRDGGKQEKVEVKNRFVGKQMSK